MALPLPLVKISAQQALAFLRQQNIPWFDDNPSAWQNWSTLAFSQSPSQWDQVTLGQYGPFLVEKIDGGYATKLDVKEHLNANFASLTLNGQKNSPVEFTLLLPTPVDLASYLMAVREMLPASNQLLPTPVTHPALAAYGLAKVFLYRADFIQPPRDGRPPSVRLEFRQFFIQGISPGSFPIQNTPQYAPENTVIGPLSVNAPPPPGPPALIDPTDTVTPPDLVG